MAEKAYLVQSTALITAAEKKIKDLLNKNETLKTRVTVRIELSVLLLSCTYSAFLGLEARVSNVVVDQFGWA